MLRHMVDTRLLLLALCLCLVQGLAIRRSGGGETSAVCVTIVTSTGLTAAAWVPAILHTGRIFARAGILMTFADAHAASLATDRKRTTLRLLWSTRTRRRACARSRRYFHCHGVGVRSEGPSCGSRLCRPVLLDTLIEEPVPPLTILLNSRALRREQAERVLKLQSQRLSASELAGIVATVGGGDRPEPSSCEGSTPIATHTANTAEGSTTHP